MIPVIEIIKKKILDAIKKFGRPFKVAPFSFMAQLSLYASELV